MKKVSFQPGKGFTIEAEGDSAKEIYRDLADLAEPFGVSNCGACKSTDIVPVVREVEGNFFYEMKCRKCHCRLTMSQSKNQKAIFPRIKYHKQHPDVKAKKAKEGDYLPNNGWEKYTPPSEDE